MTQAEFVTQTNRLKSRWKGNTYDDEFLKILWREVSRFDASWFTRVVDKFIGEMRQPPLMPEFRTEISFERERNWAREKKQHAQDAKEFYLIANDDDFRGQLIKTILDRMNGKVTDQTWDEFLRGLEKLTGRARA